MHRTSVAAPPLQPTKSAKALQLHAIDCAIEQERDPDHLINLWMDLFPGTQAAPRGTWASTTLIDNGPVNNRLDLVFVGDGYTVDDLPLYATQIDNLLPGFFAEEPFAAYASYFNVHRVDVISNESGVDEPAIGQVRDTALNMSVSATSTGIFVSTTLARSAAACAPQFEQVLAVANTTTYGGSGYYSADVGTLPGGSGLALGVALHEFGHSFGNLGDEYWTTGVTHGTYEPFQANLSIYDAAAQTAQLRKWYRWLDLPNIDTFEGGDYAQFGVYRPSNLSKMRTLSGAYEEVNVEQLVRLIYETVSPIDDATPASPVAYMADTTFFVTPMQPADHNLDIQWAVDGVDVPGATNTTFTPDYEALSDVEHSVSVRVVDNTPRVRDESLRTNYMTDTRNWIVQGGYPGTPTGLTATADADSIVVDWNDNPEPDLTHYNVYRSTTSGGPYTNIGSSTTSDYDDTTVVLGTTYYYVVSANAQGNESDASNEDFGTAGVAMPAAPQNLIATSGEQLNTLDWSDNSEPNILGYKVFRSTTSGGPYAQINATLLTSSDLIDTGLTNNVTYYYVVIARDANGNESAASAEASATPVNLPPAAPTGLAAEPRDRSVNLTWNPNTEPDFNSYFIYYSLTAGGPYEEVDNDDATSFLVGGLTNGHTYYFVIAAEDAGTLMSPYSNEVSATPVDNQPPAIPQNVTADAGFAQVQLTWSAVSDSDFAFYSIYRSTTSGGPYASVDTAEDPEYLDGGLTNEVTYYYVVTATDALSNESGYSAEVSAMPTADPVPAAPTGLTATIGDGIVSLDWNDNVEADLKEYRIYRGTVNGGPYTEIDTNTSSDFPDTSVVNGTKYYYVVSAIDNANQESPYSNQVSATPHEIIPPAPPQNLEAFPLDQGAYLDWDNNTEPDLNSYVIYISPTPGGPYDEVDSDDPSEFPVFGLTNGTQYYFVVTARDDNGNESGYSNEATTTPIAEPPPVRPRGLTATSGEGKVTLNWIDNFDSVEFYNVYRSTTSGGPYTIIASPWMSDYIDTNVISGTTYYYVVTAVNEFSDESPTSDEASATPTMPVPPPSNVSATASISSVYLAWDWVTDNRVGGYGIYRSTTSGGPYSQASAVQDNNWTDTNVVAGTTYYYVVVSIYNSQSESAYSAEVSATPGDFFPPAAPTGVVAVPTDGGANLSWNANTEFDFSEYVIYRGTTSGGPYEEIDRDDATSWADGGLTNGTTYYYVLTAVDTSGNESGYSNEAAVTPTGAQPGGYFVQSGRVEVVGSTLDVAISPVDPVHAFVLLSYGTGYTNGNTNANRVMVRGDLLDADTLRLYRGTSSNSSWVSWQVIECAGNEFTAYRGSGSFSNSQGSASLNIGASVNAANCLALVSADSNSNSRSYYSEAHLTARVDSSTTVRVERADTGSSSTNYNWTVVEFDPSKIASIQHGSLSFSSANEGNRATANISAVNPNSSILLFQSRTTRNGLAYTSVAGQLTSATSVEFYQHTGTAGTRTVEYTVIDFGVGASAQGGQIDNSGNSNWAIEDISLSPVDPSSTMTFHSMTCDGTGTAYPRGYSAAELTSSSILRIERKRWGQASYIEWQAIELPPVTP
ncbi:MAG: fibronectin type III domain-containing protein [Phycisphaerales bacterium]|nr:fibronectin type III domain-containing protein [Phycisphaerales bacterium]MCB9863026.1 fibronectin type III domain-containing protein [Phycisphaerales bacterium]